MRALYYITFLFLILVIPLIPVRAEVTPQPLYPYPEVEITGGGTMTSNATELRIEVEFELSGVFWTEQEVEVPLLNVTGNGIIYNITGTFTIENKTETVSGFFTNVSFTYGGRTYRFISMNVINATGGSLTFNGIIPKKLLFTVRPGIGNYKKFLGFMWATLWCSDYPTMIFIAKPPSLLTTRISFPK